MFDTWPVLETIAACTEVCMDTAGEMVGVQSVEARDEEQDLIFTLATGERVRVTAELLK